MTPRLSILICSIASRAEMLDRLMGRLAPQLTPAVEVLTECDSGAITIGLKRNILMDRASGDYLAYVDDDDALHDRYCELILSALATNPDCVGFKSRRYQDGRLIGDCVYSLRCRDQHDSIDNAENFRHFVRTPGHLCPVRRDLALATRFQPWCFAEDRDYERRVLPLLKTEAFVDEFLYDYLLVTKENRRGEMVHPRRWKYERPKTARPVRA